MPGLGLPVDLNAVVSQLLGRRRAPPVVSLSSASGCARQSTAQLQPIGAQQERGPAFPRVPTDVPPTRCAFAASARVGGQRTGPPKMYLRRSQRADFGTCGACGQVLRSRRLCKDKRKQAHRRARQLHSARRSVNVYREVFTLNRSTAPIQVENAREKIMS